MTNPDYTDITFLLDRSGSMASIEQATVSGFAEFIAEQRRAPGTCLVTLSRFDTEYDRVYTARPLADVPPLELEPRGMTALLDAIGRSIRETGERLRALPEQERPGQVIIGIMTDGLENASKELTHAAVKAMIERQERTYSWAFLYMGANQDAIEVGASLGVRPERAMTYTGASAAPAMAAMGSNIAAARAAVAAGSTAAESFLAFTDEQRDTAARRPSEPASTQNQ